MTEERSRRIPLPASGGFRLHVLASGSKGNAAIVETGGHAVLVDCGIACKTFLARCDEVGFNPTCIDAVVVTHEHTDHTSGLGVVLRRLAKLGTRPPVYCAQGTLNASRALLELRDTMDVRAVSHAAELQVGSIRVQLFPSSHDAADPVGMAFETTTASGTDVLGYLTDSGVLPSPAKQLFAEARILALEANHDPAMLENGPYPYYLKKRIASSEGHLSNEQSAEALDMIAPVHLQAVCGMHLSEQNNLHRLAIESLGSSGGSFQVTAAWQDAPLSIG